MGVRRIRKKQKDPLRVIGLTDGIGSMLVGARDGGEEIVGNIEWRPYYHTGTFEYNFPGAFMVKSVDDVDADVLEGIDIAYGHPECGNFSQLHTTKTEKHLKDPGDIPLFVELVQRIGPRFFVMDDLPKCLGAYPIDEWRRMLPDYDIYPEYISNYNYGNVQKNRKRFFMIGALKSEGWCFVPGELPNTLTVRQVIGDILRKWDTLPNHHRHTSKAICGKAKNMYEYGVQYTWGEVQKYWRDQKEGKVFDYHAQDGLINVRPGFYKEYWDGIGHVLSGVNPIIHPKTNMPLSLRERLRIMGFDDQFELIGTVLEDDGTWNHERNLKLVKQTGKCMPVQFCRYVYQQIAAHVRRQPFQASGERILKPNEYVDAAKLYFIRHAAYSNPDLVRENCWMGDEAWDQWGAALKRRVRKVGQKKVRRIG